MLVVLLGSLVLANKIVYKDFLLFKYMNINDKKFLKNKYIKEGLNKDQIIERFKLFDSLKNVHYKKSKDFNEEFKKLWESGI